MSDDTVAPEREREEQAWLSLQVPASMKADLEAIGERDVRTLSSVARHAFKQYISNFGVNETP